MPYCYAAILAAGNSSRMMISGSKQDISLCGKSVLQRTVETFVRSECFEKIIIAAQSEAVDMYCKIFARSDNIKVVEGGDSRQASLSRVVNYCVQESHKRPYDASKVQDAFMTVHDGARCLLSKAKLCDFQHHLVAYGEQYGLSLALPVTDTIRRFSATCLLETIPRETLLSMQTPQGSSLANYQKALQIAHEEYTDDIALLQNAGIPCRFVPGEKTNIKLTVQDDLQVMTAILQMQKQL